ncbi:hypothetical protein WK76_24870 [Burkholderia ubonensis]|uniref:hypothetical protein n=1 Tax=Burkholderia ubonensis TaxID=101571 RepID=UPI0007528345|nr:hypothetical protein [Burkholderia ubonensis]KVU84265.1 hypothetical protein WK76_24870 [Burkholderia ubonensis]
MKIDTPTYESLVAHAEGIYKRRIAELKVAEPHIREVRVDLDAVSAAGIPLQLAFGFDVRDGRTQEEDDRGARRRPALHLVIDSIFSSTEEKNQLRLLDLLLDRGWAIARTSRRSSRLPSADGYVILCKKRVHARLHFDLPGSWFDAQEALEASKASSEAPLSAEPVSA